MPPDLLGAVETVSVGLGGLKFADDWYSHGFTHSGRCGVVVESPRTD